MNKLSLIKINIFIAAIMLLLISISFVNGTGCNYKMNLIDSKNPNFQIKMTCFKGNYVALQTLKYGDSTSKWKITARQFNLFNQVILYINKRSPLVKPTYNNKLDDYNQLVFDQRLLFYAYKIDKKKNTITVYEDFPERRAITTEFTGKISQW
ncbi:hypothetical protein ACTFQF_21155 [Aliivibrio fischeri]|uniref:hypothetical protein n=2 Tax=Aliivibrio fischeri TaxID=668 RepID=UPI0007C4315C|nr:hypothetical protein [Aliivibrio fischeri]MBP3139889.1 hypothetical protein [Aliivibrio fischeri]MBP3154269.1 hypothetical protein [Aliivibrio fischeri]MCE7536106.1 hypothetical protein [Aliivibrio fischeri]MCE7558892.1 hypothetical protein [Aliivibrio fischeri]MCE7565439.1 hypothetical protein [Aliivibrio fischeri]